MASTFVSVPTNYFPIQEEKITLTKVIISPKGTQPTFAGLLAVVSHETDMSLN